MSNMAVNETFLHMSIDNDLKAKAKAKAKEEERSLAGYIRSLLKRDLDEKPKGRTSQRTKRAN